ADIISARRQTHLEREFSQSTAHSYSSATDSLRGIWQGYAGGPESRAPEVDTGVERRRLVELLEAMTRHPADFHAHPKIENAIHARQQMARGERPVDWSAGEALAFASLAVQGKRVRLTGQDSERGTFSHRHAVLHDIENGNTHYVFQHLSP